MIAEGLLTQRVGGYSEKTEQKRELDEDLHIDVSRVRMVLQTCCENVQMLSMAGRLKVKLDVEELGGKEITLRKRLGYKSSGKWIHCWHQRALWLWFIVGIKES